MEYQTIALETFNIIGIEARTTNENDQSRQDISSLWKRFYSEKIANLISNKTSDEITALYTDYEQDFTKPYTIVIGFKVENLDNIPSGLTGRKIAAANYAVFTVNGKLPDELINMWKSIWNSSIPRAYTSDFEVYGERAKDRDNAQMQVYVSIKQQS